MVSIDLEQLPKSRQRPRGLTDAQVQVRESGEHDELSRIVFAQLKLFFEERDVGGSVVAACEDNIELIASPGGTSGPLAWRRLGTGEHAARRSQPVDFDAAWV